MSNTDKIKIAAIVGPTASGKTSLGVYLAERLSGEVISADSMQIYKGMDIATAKPAAYEMGSVRHHLIDFLEPDKLFSVADFTALANKTVDDIIARKRIPIVVGGTGLYIDSMLSGVQLLDSPCDEGIRSALKKRLKEEGAQALLDELSETDPQTAARLHPNNTVRIIRALELYQTTGKTITQQNIMSKAEPSRYTALYLGIDFHDRGILYNRINKRVDLMLENGLLDEARSYYETNKSATASAAIGYKELKPYIDNEASLEDCVNSLKTATRHYAKRQLTWFRRNPDTIWFYFDDYGCFDELCQSAYDICKEWFD